MSVERGRLSAPFGARLDWRASAWRSARRAPAAGPNTDTGCIDLVAGKIERCRHRLPRPGGTMAELSGVNHVSLSVTDLDRSERFYTDVFDLIRMMDVGYGRILLHPQTGFIFGIVRLRGRRRTLHRAEDRSRSRRVHCGQQGRASRMGAETRHARRRLHPHQGHGVRLPPELP